MAVVNSALRPVVRWSRCLLAAGLLASLLPAKAQVQDPFVEAREVRSWLMRMHDAARQNNFQGTFVVSAGGTVTSARIVHFRTAGDQYERIETLDGEMRRVYRHNDIVHTLWPQSRVAVVEQRDSMNAFPALLQSRGDRIVEFYDIKPLGLDRVAGYEAHVLGLRPKDAFRFGYRLWAERQSGLLLRAEVRDEADHVLESSAFSEVSIGIKPQLDAVVLPMKKLEGYRVLRPSMVATDLEQEGWTLRIAVPGFRAVNCVKRPLDSTTDAGGDMRMLQAIYADGLTYVSIFIEPYSPAMHKREMVMALGATQTLMRRQGDWWVTVMGDVPVATLRSFAAGLDRLK